jgi:REP element-mobilizing transposase RayT
MARGNARLPIFLDDVDRQRFVLGLCRVAARLEWQALAYCLMPNHYHLVVETVHPNLAKGMRDINGGYGQAFNRRHDRVGHVFQGRYKALIVEEGSYLLQLLRYVARNPVDAGLCADAADWAWSSHGAILGSCPVPPCLSVHGVLRHFGADTADARTRYARFVGAEGPAEYESSANAVVVGSEAYAASVLGKPGVCASAENPRNHRIIRSLDQYQRDAGQRNLAIRRAHASGSYSLAEIGRHFGLHYSTVSRICGAHRRGNGS